MKRQKLTFRKTSRKTKFSERGHYLLPPNSNQNQISYLSDHSSNIAAPFWNWLRLRPMRRILYPMDIVCLIYLKIMLLLSLIYRQNLENDTALIMPHLLFLLGTYLIIIFRQSCPQNRYLFILGIIYPVAIIAFGWNSLSQLVPLIYGNYWATSWVVTFDKFLFGTYPTIWCEQFYRPWLDECMNVFYSGYYLFMPLTLLTLLIKRKHAYLIYALSLASFTYLGSYILYCIFPTLGPSMTPEITELSSQSHSGYLFSAITRWIQSGGSVIGAAFPSSHVAGSVIWTVIALKIRRPIGIFLTLMTPGIAISTVYLGYHHAIDPLSGMIWGFLSYKLVEPTCKHLINPQNIS